MVRLAGRDPLTGPGGVLVDAGDGRVDRDDQVEVTFRIGLGERSGEDLLRVPSAAHFRSRLWAPFHDPKCSGRSIHGAIASITCR